MLMTAECACMAASLRVLNPLCLSRYDCNHGRDG